ncbi:MAG: uroporphyrinogen-III C-methyltransferase [Paludibacter sp.]|nr:uroporphyrinogen-III C-methyltransferase [Paludibacter sp.]
MSNLKVISRKSPLALVQVQEVFDFYPALKYELIVLESYGDKHKEISLLENPPVDLFTRELDQAILNGTADIAIHSAKDLPYPLAPGLEVIALFAADDQTDSLVSRNDSTLKELPIGAKVGTSSPARRKELLAIRPDVQVVSIRGTIEERIELVDEGKIDALIVASCALQRLGLTDRVAEELPFETHPLQGNLAIVSRTGRQDLKLLFKDKDSRTHYGTVTLVGFGPGNPDLLTIGGDKALSKADIIFHDDLLDKDYLEKYNAEKVYVGKRKNLHSFEQDDINRLLLDAAKAGKQVVRLKGGDPMVFAHGGEEIEYLQKNFVQVAVIPGVSSGIAVSSLTKVPLTHRGIASSVAFISGHSEDVKIPDTDTLVYYMSGANIKLISQKAIAQGKNPKTPVLLTYNVSMPDQQEFFSTLEELAAGDTVYPTPVIIVIGDVVALKNNSEQAVAKPVILVTGTQKEQYEQVGKVIHQPLIQIDRIDPNPELDIALDNLQQYDWIFFTSRYTVNYFFEAIYKKGKDSRSLTGIKIASVGKVTSQALKEAGIIPDLQASVIESSEGLLKDIQSGSIAPAKVLIPRSDLGLPVLPDGLTKLGWEVTTLPVYRNTYPENLKPLDVSKVQVIVFSSPSCVTNFIRLYGHFPEGKEYIFRGKETEKRFNELRK